MMFSNTDYLKHKRIDHSSIASLNSEYNADKEYAFVEINVITKSNDQLKGNTQLDYTN